MAKVQLKRNRRSATESSTGGHLRCPGKKEGNHSVSHAQKKKKKKKKNKVYESSAETEGPHLVREGKKGNVACS
jgi:hypothetical protein